MAKKQAKFNASQAVRDALTALGLDMPTKIVIEHVKANHPKADWSSSSMITDSNRSSILVSTSRKKLKALAAQASAVQSAALDSVVDKSPEYTVEQSAGVTIEAPEMNPGEWMEVRDTKGEVTAKFDFTGRPDGTLPTIDSFADFAQQMRNALASVHCRCSDDNFITFNDIWNRLARSISSDEIVYISSQFDLIPRQR